jgi:hypothetical protein
MLFTHDDFHETICVEEVNRSEFEWTSFSNQSQKTLNRLWTAAKSMSDAASLHVKDYDDSVPWAFLHYFRCYWENV